MITRVVHCSQGVPHTLPARGALGTRRCPAERLGHSRIWVPCCNAVCHTRRVDQGCPVPHDPNHGRSQCHMPTRLASHIAARQVQVQVATTWLVFGQPLKQESERHVGGADEELKLW